MRKSLLSGLIAAAGLACTAYGQATDACGSAPVVGEGTFAYDLTGATNDFAGTCGATDAAEDVWYLYVPSACGTVTISTCGLAGSDTVLSALGACGGPVLACNDDSCGLQSTISFYGSAGVGYPIRMAEFFGGVHAGSISITLAAGPAPNDECGGALAIGPGVTSFNTTCGTSSAGGGCDFSGPDLWYAYTATVNGTASISTCGTAGYDTVLSVDADCAGTNIACNDDACGLQSTVGFAISAGTTYFVKIDGFGGGAGAGSFTVTETNSGAPLNDNCANPTPVSLGVTAITNGNATTDGPSNCGIMTNDVWYAYTAGSSCSTTISTCSELRTFDTVLSAYTGDCGTLALVGCNDDGPPACTNPGVPFSGSTITFDAVAGTTYLIQVGGFNGASGSTELTITQNGPANDSCANAIPVAEGTIAYSNGCATNDGPASCGLIGSDIWYLYSATSSAAVTASTCSPLRTHDTVLAVYDAPCTGAELGCNDDGPPACTLPGVPFSGSTVTFAPVAGNQYLIRVGGFNSSQGSGELTITRACFGSCTADFDDGSGTGSPDGGVTIDDLLYYLAIFEEGVLCADVDDGSFTGTQDAGVTIDDLLYYLFRFEEGC